MCVYNSVYKVRGLNSLNNLMAIYWKGPVLDVLNCDGNIAAPNYDSETGLCKCGKSQNRLIKACSNSTPFCVDGSCLCSHSFNSYIKGVSIKGTCQGTEMCLDDGVCVGMLVNVSLL